MSYYILPKKHVGIKIEPTIIPITVKIKLQPIISFSLSYHLDEIKNQIKNINTNTTNNNNNNNNNNNDDLFNHSNSSDDVPEFSRSPPITLRFAPDRINYTIEFIDKIINPYEFIFSTVPSSKYSVSKIKPTSNLFYIFMEIVQTFNLLDIYQGKNSITMAHFGPNALATTECMEMLREGNNDNTIISDIEYPYGAGFKLLEGIDNTSIDFIYFELSSDMYTDINKYILGIITILCNILTYQNAKGVCIIKVDNLIHKPILDALLLLTELYEKVHIIKPYVCNINKNERYIVCSTFIIDYQKILENNIYLNKLKSLLIDCLKESFNNKIISSLINRDLPYYFLNKIEESNIIIGHQQLEQHNLLINIIKNKNRDDKIETIKKNHIYKCIQWCERHKIPYNKFVDKINMFLPSITYDDNEEHNGLEKNKYIYNDNCDVSEEDEEEDEYTQIQNCIEKERIIQNELLQLTPPTVNSGVQSLTGAFGYGSLQTHSTGDPMFFTTLTHGAFYCA
jgi:hypothetical protein